jgi:hypothetical protein
MLLRSHTQAELQFQWLGGLFLHDILTTSHAPRTCISSKHSRAAMRSPPPLLLLLAPAATQPLRGSGPGARMKLLAAADITAALAAAS